MDSLFKASCRFLLSLFCTGLLGLPLQAQLNPRLQATATDFLDLYQQSTTQKVKPEILTIFDFSGSMSTLMFHPQYVNNDSQDSESPVSMNFTLNKGGAAVAGNNTYTITATSAGDINVSSSMTFTLNNNATSVSTTNPYSSGYWDTPYRTKVAFSSSDISCTSTNSSNMFAPGATVTFSFTVWCYNPTYSGISVNTGASWDADTGASPSYLSGNGTNKIAKYATTSFVSTATWTVPAWDPGTPATGAYVSANVGIGTCTQLVKPNGSVVTSADADLAKTSGSSLLGVSFGSSDVRNWVRAASHARFVYSDNGTSRSIDIPLPWKIMTASSTGNPLSSQTVLDQVTQVGADGTPVTYGSGKQIEMDLNYQMSNGQYVLSGGSTQQTSTTLKLTTGQAFYRPTYLKWLFTGKYANGSYSGTNAKYVVFDSATTGLAGGQTTSASLAWGQGFGTFNPGDNIMVPQYSPSGTYLSESSNSASVNAIPTLTRCQAVKRAAIQTWIQYQASVYWAFRFLDVNNESNNSTINNDSNSSIDTSNPTTTQMDGGDSGWTLLNNTSTQGNTSTSGNSVTGMTRIAALFPANGTPLTYAMARGLAQFSDPNSVFNAVETVPSQCMSHFLILFTDGADNNNTNNLNPNGTTPYLVTSGNTTAVSAAAGNLAVINNTGSVDRDGNYWNIFTYAGMGAHLADASLSSFMGAPRDANRLENYPTSDANPDQFMPFAIPSRNGVAFGKDHLITTMTFGLSLAGSYTTSPSSKRNLFLAAAVGDPTLPSWPDLSTITPFQWNPAANNGQGARIPGSVYFFDSMDPTALSLDLSYAIMAASAQSNINATANPNLPFVGAAFGQEIYLGKFQPPSNGGAVWGGDMLMFATKTVGGQVEIIDKNGAQVSVVDNTTSQWSASDALLNGPLWSSRTLYTRLPNATDLSTFTDTGTSFDDGKGGGLVSIVATGGANPYTTALTSAQKAKVIQFAAGGNIYGTLDTASRPTANRPNIMGDVINSAPSSQQYNWADVSSSLSPYSRLTAVGGNVFRLILVGTNQGWLHAFGEVTATSTAPSTINGVANPNAGTTITSGNIQELWAFMPTDFLANLDYLTQSGNVHRFMVDGTPSIYFLDLPGTGGSLPNGVLDIGTSSSTSERGIAVIGLRKGGRSYYALDIHNPFTPKLLWSLVPDEVTATNIHARNSTSLSDAQLAKLISNMGFSTCTPAFGRVFVGGTLASNTAYNVLTGGIPTDVVFLGGGLSYPSLELNFPTYPLAKGTTNPDNPLGRSVLAINVYTGNILAAVDLTDSTQFPAKGAGKVGPISAGLVPFEYFLNSGMAQRAYFMDDWGGLWSWGSRQISSATSTNGYRIDASNLSSWTFDGKSGSGTTPGIRKVYQDTDTVHGSIYTTLPAPWVVGSFPGAAQNSGTINPTAVGIAMVSGDRNNPTDSGYTTANRPTNHRITVVFDRQDSNLFSVDNGATVGTDAGIQDSNLLAAGASDPSGTNSSSLAYTDTKIIPGSSNYYLAPTDGKSTTYLGYYINFESSYTPKGYSNIFIPKGINTPSVVTGSLYYSFFVPETYDPCVGGSGSTYSWYIADVLNPIVKDTRGTDVMGTIPVSGQFYKWVGVASDFFGLGSKGVLQGGTIATPNLPANPPPGTSTTTIHINTTLGNTSSGYPKVIVWRTIH